MFSRELQRPRQSNGMPIEVLARYWLPPAPSNLELRAQIYCCARASKADTSGLLSLAGLEIVLHLAAGNHRALVVLRLVFPMDLGEVQRELIDKDWVTR